MQIKVNIQTITIKDEQTGEIFRVKTLRTAAEIARDVTESEKDILVDRVQEVVSEALLD